MKKLILATITVLSLIACDNDDERIVISEEIPPTDKEETVEFTTYQVNYTFSASEDFREFYHFLIGYMDVTGQQHIDTLKDDKWQYSATPIPLAEAPDKFVCVIRAERKEDDSELTKYAYTLSYEQDISVTLSNDDGSEVRTFDAGPMTSWSWQASPASMGEFLASYSNTTLVKFVLEKSAFSNLE